VGYPAPPSFVQQLMEQFGVNTGSDMSVFLNYEPGRMYARIPYTYDIR